VRKHKGGEKAELAGGVTRKGSWRRSSLGSTKLMEKTENQKRAAFKPEGGRGEIHNKENPRTSAKGCKRVLGRKGARKRNFITGDRKSP